MMWALLYKEVKTLLPFLGSVVGIWLLHMGFTFASVLPDQFTYVPEHWLMNQRSSTLQGLMLYGLLIGAGLLVNEHQQGTMSFLDGLPVSRNRIYVSKIGAGFLMFGAMPLLNHSGIVVLDSLARNSVQGDFPWKFIFVQTGLQLAVCMYILAIAAVLSFFRRWFALVVGLLYWGYVSAVQAAPGWMRFLDPGETLKPALANGEVHLPWRHLAVQGSASAFLLVIAWLAFRSLGDRLQHSADSLHRYPLLRALGTGVRFLVPVALLVGGAVLVKARGDKKDKGRDLAVVDEAFGRRETTHYEFLFRKSQEDAVRPLMDSADEVWLKVAGYFALSPSSDRILVDLASPLMQHAAGMTNWKKIRLRVHPDLTGDKWKAVFGHETAHVFTEQLSDGRTSELFRYCRFLHEGLASHIDLDAFGTDDELRRNRRAVAGAWVRGKVPFAVLCDNEALGASRDPNLVYTLGETYARALRETHGNEAIPRLIRALARPGAPQGLKGVALWRDTMQAAWIDFDRVEAAYEAACDRLVSAEAEHLKSLPRITATVMREGNELVIKPIFSGAAPYQMVCVIDVPDPLMNDMRRLRPKEDGAFHLSADSHPSETLRYMLGWRDPEGGLPVFEPWVEIPVP